MINIQNVFNQFCTFLQNRKGIMTEDNIRYYWFAAMLQEDLDLNNYTLEYPYSNLNVITPGILQNEELDLLYENNTENEFFCFEMKFHRNNTNNTFAKTSAAGGIFNDLQRLQQIANPGARRFFLYVTDSIMYVYLSNNNGKDLDYSQLLMDFCALQAGNAITLNFNNAPLSPSTFKDSANKSLNINTLPEIQNLLLLYEDDFPCISPSFANNNNNNNNNNCHVRLYEIL